MRSFLFVSVAVCISVFLPFAAGVLQGMSAADALAHVSDKPGTVQAAGAAPLPALTPAAAQSINADYVARVKPIFENKCFDCHTNRTIYPWYYSVPGVKQLIDYDTAEALEHMDMSNDFPFQGHHGSVAKDLDEIEEVVSEGEMPLLLYRVMHQGSTLTDKNKQIILDWITQARARLQSVGTVK